MNEKFIKSFEEILDLEQVLYEALLHNDIGGGHFATQTKIIISKLEILLEKFLDTLNN